MSIDRSQARRLLAGAASAALLATAFVQVAPARAADPTPSSTSAQNVTASKNVTFGVQPAVTSGRDARPAFSFGATHGATLRDRVAIMNYSRRPLRLTVYATDAENTADGGFALLPAGQKPTGVGSWVRLDLPAKNQTAADATSGTITVPARTASKPGQVIVPVTLVVPANATPGDHAGGVVAALETVTQRPGGANIRLEQRVATRVYVRVSGTLHPALSIEGLQAKYRGTLDPAGAGSAVITYTVRNTGNVKLGATQAVTITGWFGAVNAPAPQPIALLLPGGSEQVTATVDGVVPTFLRSATVSLTALAPASDADPGLPAITASAHFLAVPWTLLGLALLVLLAIVWSLTHRRRRADIAPSGRHSTAPQRVGASS